MSISSRGWNKKGLKAGRPRTKPRRILTVKVTVYDGRRHPKVRYIIVDKLPVGRTRLYEVSIYHNSIPKGRHAYASRHSFKTISDAESKVIRQLDYYGIAAAWNFRTDVVRRR